MGLGVCKLQFPGSFATWFLVKSLLSVAGSDVQERGAEPWPSLSLLLPLAVSEVTLSPLHSCGARAVVPHHVLGSRGVAALSTDTSSALVSALPPFASHSYGVSISY